MGAPGDVQDSGHFCVDMQDSGTNGNRPSIFRAEKGQLWGRPDRENVSLARHIRMRPYP